MIDFEEGKEKWTCTVHSIIYLMHHPMDSGRKEQESWVRPQAEHLIRESFNSLTWVVSLLKFFLPSHEKPTQSPCLLDGSHGVLV